MVPQLTTDIANERLTEIENDYNVGDITKKGYCNKKWEVLKAHASELIVKEVDKLKCRLQVDLSEDSYCYQMMELLDKVALPQSNKATEQNGVSNGKSEIKENGKENGSPKKSENELSDMFMDSDDESPPITSPIKSPFIKNKVMPKISFRGSHSKSDTDACDDVKEEPKDTEDIQDTKTDINSNDHEDAINDNDEDDEKPLAERASNEILCPLPGPSNKSGKFAKKSLSASKSKKKPEGKSAGNRKSLTSYFSREAKAKAETSNVKEEPMDTDVPIKEEDIKKEESYDGEGITVMKEALQGVEDDEEDLKPAKRVKTEADNKPVERKKKSVTTDPKKCEICHQLLSDSDLRPYAGHPHNAVEEFVALTDPKLNVFTGDEEEVHEDDMRPSVKVTQYSIYDKEGHLCPIDSGLIERNVFLYFSGYLKPIYEEDPSPEGGVPAKDVGPINEWWVCGYDGGEKAIVGFSTGYGEYFLMEPSEQYIPLMESLNQKIYMGKIVIEFLLDAENPSYEDLLDHIQHTVPPQSVGQLSEDSLLKHSQFICDQVASFDAASPGEDDPLIATPCMRALIHYAGITFGKRQLLRRGEKKQFKDKKPKWTKATTTPLVKEVFETFFTGQIDESDASLALRKKRCGVCDACQLPDCGSCRNCLAMVKFGGNGKMKKACIKRKCPNIAVAEADESDPEDEEEYEAAAERKGKNKCVSLRSERSGSGNKNVSWVGEPIKDDGKRIFYQAAIVGEEELSVGDCVSVEPSNLTSPVVIGKISYMWQNSSGQKYMHVSWFCRSSETVLGEAGDSSELFQINDCENTLLCGIKSKVTVDHWPAPATWCTDGGQPLPPSPASLSDNPDKHFYYRFKYDERFARFEDVLPDPPCRNAAKHRFCASCERQYLEDKYDTPSVDEKLEEKGPKNETMYGLVRWRGQEYRPGTCVYLQPSVFNFKQYGLVFTAESRKSNDVDEEMYPEYYRKASEYVRGSNDDTPQPFCIGLITAIVTSCKDQMVTPSDICVRVVKFYRPENTVGVTTRYDQFDLNMLYSSDEEKVVNFLDVTGKCYVVYRENLVEDVSLWTKAGPHRFYFSEGYDPKTKSIVDPTKTVKILGDLGKGGTKSKGKGKSGVSKKWEEAVPWPKYSRPLRCLDVFAGCGGLSEGLHQAGVAETKWAIEKEEDAAHAFRLNNPSAVVFGDDCNTLLKMVLQGEEKIKGQKLPQKGEVEMLVGGPPCQGFSGMNRFNHQQYSLFKNSLIVSYLAYCDYYRPKFFILENVRNFVSFKNCMVLKLTLRCLTKMGYQVTFGVLQAGHYGVPQSRRRAIIVAAAPGEILPKYPEPQHTFHPRVSKLSVMVEDKKFTTNCEWEESAPYRTITVNDAMSDLPEISNGACKEEIPYNGDPRTHFQKWMRGDQYQSMLRDHICKEMSPLVTARIAHIPTASGSDWRDLPNICVLMSSNVMTKKLQYTHHDKKNGRSSTGALRGVCACASGKACDPMDRQFNTLIPWCLPHTGNRHNHWAGLYGRLEWEGYFSTTVTNPEPMGKQGRVLHPEQTRVVSVRECARSQGFPDKYRFYGNILAKHRQVGNAVPPPMGCAIGREILKSLNAKDAKLEAAEKL